MPYNWAEWNAVHRPQGGGGVRAAGGLQHQAVQSRKVASRAVHPEVQKAREADEATEHAFAHPSPENHLAAREAHQEASKAFQAPGLSRGRRDEDAMTYHIGMAGLHYHLAAGTANREPSVLANHEDPHTASRFPKADFLSHITGFQNRANHEESQANYKSVPEARKTGLSNNELASIKAYTRGSDRAINNHLRGNDQGLQATSEAKSHVPHLESAFGQQKPLESDLVTYRGTTNHEEMFGPVGSRVGREFQDKGVTSTSTHASNTYSFGSGHEHGALIRVLSPAGSHVLSPAGAGGFGRAEHEVMMPAGSRYHIAADRQVRTHEGKIQRQIDLIRKED